MIQIEENISLKTFNSFGIDVEAKAAANFSNIEDLGSLLEVSKKYHSLLVLGGGSNVLFTKPFDGLILLNRIDGIQVQKETEEHVYVQAGAGVPWHGFVLHCIDKGWGGIENLSLIPGCVGASPMQNIGAYGVEIKDVFESLEALQISGQNLVTFEKTDCRFGYRESVFKRELKNQFIITSVTFKLDKNPVFKTSYGAIQQELEAMGIQELSIKAISDAVIRIRQSKLPDPKITGNAGSFFKNPEIDLTQYLDLKQQYTDLPGYPTTLGKTKIPAGYLIEKAGWKGYREGDAGVNTRQALVLVNYGHATGSEIYNLSEKILQSVKTQFDINLEREVNIL